MLEGNDNFAFMRIVWRLMDEHPGKTPEQLFPLFSSEIGADGNEDVMKSALEYALEAALREEGGEYA